MCRKITVPEKKLTPSYQNLGHCETGKTDKSNFRSFGYEWKTDITRVSGERLPVEKFPSDQWQRFRRAPSIRPYRPWRTDAHVINPFPSISVVSKSSNADSDVMCTLKLEALTPQVSFCIACFPYYLLFNFSLVFELLSTPSDTHDIRYAMIS
jgi:hypothetical protein